MNYIIITNYFPPELGAAANRIYNLSSALNETNNVSVICPLPNYPTGNIFKGYKYKLFKTETLDGIKVYRNFIYPTTSKNFILRGLGMLSFSVSIWVMLFRWRALKSVDLIIVQNSPLLVSLSSIILFRKVFKKKLVLNVSDIWPDSAKTLEVMSENSRMYKLFKKIEFFNYINSTAIVGQSEEIIKHVSGYVDCPTFLYRNLQPLKSFNSSYSKFPNFRIVYAGLLGVAQGLMKMAGVSTGPTGGGKDKQGSARFQNFNVSGVWIMSFGRRTGGRARASHGKGLAGRCLSVRKNTTVVSCMSESAGRTAGVTAECAGYRAELGCGGWGAGRE